MGCKWWVLFDQQCLLGRSIERCGNNPARRGDDELVDRVLGLPETERDELARRLERIDKNVRSIANKEDPESE